MKYKQSLNISSSSKSTQRNSGSNYSLRIIIATTIFVALIFSMVWLPFKATAQTASEQISLDAYKRLLQFTFLENAASKGSYGTYLGVGFSQHHPEYSDNQEEPLSQNISRLWIAKGLPIPVNLGLHAAHASDYDLLYFVPYLQWTIFERLAWPALGVRYGYGFTAPNESVQIAAHMTELIASYGFLRYFTIHAGLGFRQTSINMTPEAPSSTVNPIHEVTTSKEIKLNNAYLYSGLAIKIFSPFLTLAGEVSRPLSLKSNQEQSYAVKLGYLM